MSAASMVLSAGCAVAGGASLLLSGYQAPGVDEGDAGWAWRACGLALLCLALCSVMASALAWDSSGLQQLRSQLKASGWYAWRRPLQVSGLLLLLGACGWLLCRLARLPLSRAARICAWACVGLWLLWLNRMLSLHWVDALMHARLAGVGLGRWLEVLGLGLVGLACVVRWRRVYVWK